MSSDLRAPAQIPANKLYVNTSGIQSSIFDETGANKVTWVVDRTAIQTAGGAVLRDMGKTVYLPAGSTSATQSTVLRKVQLVTNTSVAGDAASSTDAGYLTGYIQIGGMTYGGGNGAIAPVARLN